MQGPAGLISIPSCLNLTEYLLRYKPNNYWDASHWSYPSGFHGLALALRQAPAFCPALNNLTTPLPAKVLSLTLYIPSSFPP